MRRYVQAVMVAVVVLPLSALETRLSAQDVDPCTLITKAEAAQILGNPEILKAKSMPPQDGTCGYLGAPFDVHTETLKSASGWSAMVKKEIQAKRAEAVEKIGDEAAFTTDGNGDFVMTSRTSISVLLSPGVSITTARRNHGSAKAARKWQLSGTRAMTLLGNNGLLEAL